MTLLTSSDRMSVYDRLGVPRIINGTGAKTRLSGTMMPKEVVDSMFEASWALVDIEHLRVSRDDGNIQPFREAKKSQGGNTKAEGGGHCLLHERG